ncbi:P60-like protein [Ceraceosorus guamensis]|uniref:Ribosome biogenesis protein NOP53 n=1 Tax=Ceraceosorus guamensis TaxID=1522189 RepID=A0A316W639_9BASI|nr:P60-like protein [Ceraceosorus guamensis]PWN43493.1 P60-like protein [Ceraceosorus guamensis]
MPKSSSAPRSKDASGLMDARSGQSSRRTSRKNKASWRKHVDLSEVEAGMEEARARERAGLPSRTSTKGKGKGKKIDDETEKDKAAGFDELFVEDRVGDEDVARQLARSHRLKKPLRSMEGLQSSSAVPALTGRAKRQDQSKSSEGQMTAEDKRRARLNRISKSQKDQLKRLAGHTIRGPFGAVVEGEQGRVREAAPDAHADIWQDATADERGAVDVAAAEEEEDEWLANAQREFNKLPTKAPRTLGASVHVSRPAISQPHAGQSYNPTLESHDALLARVGAEAVAHEHERLRHEAFKKEWDDGGKIAKMDEADAKRVRGEDEAEAPVVKKDPKRKTRVQLNRAKRVRHEQTLRLAAKAAKIQRAQLSSLSALKKAALEAEAKRVASRLSKLSSRESRLSKAGLAGQRLGKFKVPKPKAEDDVQLGEELSENLRSLRPEGNLFRDRFQSLTVRGLIEPRMKVTASGRHKRGGKGKKTYEAHSYKRFI